jgi:ATP-dependent helicase HrpA
VNLPAQPVRPPRPDAAARPAREPRPPRPATPIPPITYPESLPVSSRREEIARALATHQVVIVCGETGSGKTTQLPKIALELGRGLGAGGQGLIGHTQPRRLAATSVAKRIADELNSPLGEVVGYKVRFQDRLQPGASVKLMTDGILLAETQGDPDLRQYDTLIIDEAHERSLNIDFLLGYLRQLLPRRPDLKIVVTSATIDADRFAKHFESRLGPAPVIQVSGRLFRSSSAGARSRTAATTILTEAIADAVDELWQERRRATSWSSCRASARSATPPTTCASTWPSSTRPRRGAQAARSPRSCRCSPACRRPSRRRCSTPATAGASCWPPTSPRPRSPCRASAT